VTSPLVGVTRSERRARRGWWCLKQQLDDATCEYTGYKTESVDFSLGSLTTDGDRQTAPNGAVVPVDQGSHALTLCVYTSSGTGGNRCQSVVGRNFAGSHLLRVRPGRDAAMAQQLW
jgi:hypothetical protein